MNLDEEKRLLAGWRGRRLLACRAGDLLRAVAEALGEDDGSCLPPDGELPAPPSEAQRNELCNAITSLQRMILLWNDGHVSPSRLQRF